MGLKFSCTLILFLTFVAANAAAAPLNRHCPVLSDRLADKQYVHTHEGQEIAFCCDVCREAFKAEPEKYVANLPSGGNAHQHGAGFNAGAAAGKYWGLETRHWLIVLVSLLLLALLFRRIKRSQGAAHESNGIGRPLLLLANVVLVGLTIGFGVSTYLLVQQLDEKHRFDVVHFATFHDFGRPPVPKKPPLAPRLQGTYYRGNDERDAKLFNGGNYLTAKFHLSLQTADGVPVKHGTDVGGKELFVRYEIERAPYTPDFFFSDQQMSKIFITRSSKPFLFSDGPVADAVSLTTVEPLQRWEALYPLGQVNAQGGQDKKSIVYVAEKRYEDDAIIGSRFHYAIQFRLFFKDGIVGEASDLWMGALYRTRKFPVARLPIEEWFSHEPIPELPGKNIADPKLLGVTDYLDE